VKVTLVECLARKTLEYRDDIDFFHFVLWGAPGSGKTTTAFTIARLITECGGDLTVYRCLQLGHVFTHMKSYGAPPTRGLFIIIDDAEFYGYSRRVKPQHIFNHDFIRHNLRALGWRFGYVILFYATQRVMNLHATFRDADVIMAKPAPLVDPRAVEVFVNIFGWRAVYESRKLYSMKLINDDWKSYNIVRILGGEPYIAYIPPLPPPESIDLWMPYLLTQEERSDGVMIAVSKILEEWEKGRLPIKRYRRTRRQFHYVTKEMLLEWGIKSPLHRVAKALAEKGVKAELKKIDVEGRTGLLAIILPTTSKATE